MMTRRAIIRRALYFDGIDDYVRVAHSASLNPTQAISIEAWVKIKGDYQTMIRKEKVYLLEVGDQNWGNRGRYLQFGVWSAAGGLFQRLVESTVPLPINEWKHVVAVYDKVFGYIYIDGILNKRDNAVGYTGDIHFSTLPLLIAKSGSETFGGHIGEIRIYNRALSQAEILWLYNNGRGRPSQIGIRDGCVLCLDPSRWRGSGWVKDISGYSNHGQIYGATRVRCDL